MACSNTYLDKLYILRDRVIDAMENGKPLVEIGVRGRSARYEPPTVAMEKVQRWIDDEERRLNAARGPARNVARVNR